MVLGRERCEHLMQKLSDRKDYDERLRRLFDDASLED